MATSTEPVPNRQRMADLAGTPMRVFEQANLSYQDFYRDEYGYYEPLEQAEVESLIEMADLTSGTSGILNKIFGGRTVWAQVNTANNAWGALPKSRRTSESPYGWRAKTAFADTGSGGVAEGSIPTAVTSSYQEVAPSIKETAIKMRVSGLQQDLTRVDDAYGRIQDLRGEMADEHGKQFERAVTTIADTTAGNDVESLDRVTASSPNAATLYSAASDVDIFGIDRSANTWADAQQNENGTTNRVATLDLLNTNFQSVQSAGGDPSYALTGWDTWQEISKLTEDRGRHPMDIQSLDNGSLRDADLPDGKAISTFVGTYQGRPIVVSDQVPTDGISRWYWLDVSNPEGFDKPRLGVDVLRPTQVFTAGETSDDNPLQIDFTGDALLAHTRAELGCRFFAAQGQVRDLKAN